MVTAVNLLRRQLDRQQHVRSSFRIPQELQSLRCIADCPCDTIHQLCRETAHISFFDIDTSAGSASLTVSTDEGHFLITETSSGSPDFTMQPPLSFYALVLSTLILSVFGAPQKRDLMGATYCAKPIPILTASDGVP